MRKKIIVFVLLIVSYECNGGSILNGILNKAHEIHNNIHGAAGTFYDGVGQLFGLRKPEKSTETVVVVVENHANPENNRPNHQGHNGPYNENIPHNTPSQNYGNNNNNPNYGQNNNNGFENQNNNGKPIYNQHTQPGFGNSNNQGNTPGYDQSHITKAPNQDKYVHPTPAEKNEGNINKDLNDDKPTFIPLKPNEYIYGGDKISVNTPKRETEVKPKPVENDEEEFKLDIRMDDE